MISLTRITHCSRLVSRVCVARYLSAGPSISFKPYTPAISSSRTFATNKEENDKKFKWPFHMTMTSEQKEAKEKRIEEMKQFLHTPDLIVEKIQNTPPSAGVAVIALILYKLATPLRYATTLVFIQGTFWVLRRMGKLRTVREVEYKVRTEYEKTKHFYGRKMYRYRNLGVRDASRKNSAGQIHYQQKTGSPPPEAKK